MKGIPLVITDHPLLKSLNAIINKNLSLLYMHRDMKKVIYPANYFAVFINLVSPWL